MVDFSIHTRCTMCHYSEPIMRATLLYVVPCATIPSSPADSDEPYRIDSDGKPSAHDVRAVRGVRACLCAPPQHRISQQPRGLGVICCGQESQRLTNVHRVYLRVVRVSRKHPLFAVQCACNSLQQSCFTGTKYRSHVVGKRVVDLKGVDSVECGERCASPSGVKNVHVDRR